MSDIFFILFIRLFYFHLFGVEKITGIMGICQSYPDVLISSLTDYFCPSGRKVLRHEKLPDLLACNIRVVVSLALPVGSYPENLLRTSN
jgi:hypothetical protein